MKYLLIALAFLMVGCSNKVPVQIEHPIQQEILLQRCTEDTPIPLKKTVDTTGQAGYDGTEVFRVLRDWQSVYDDCATKMDALITVLRKVQDPNLKVTIKE